MADEQVNQEQPPSESQGGELEVKLETGEVFRGTPDQIIEAMKHAQEETHRTLSRERETATTLRTLIEQRGLRDGETPTHAQLKKMTPEERQAWFGRLALEPDAAVDELEKRRAGMTLREAAETIKALKEKVERQEQFGHVAQFYGNIGGHEELGREGAAAVMDRVQKEGWPVDSEHLELAYYRLQREGKIQGGTNRQPAPPKAPPRLDGQGAREFNLTEEQLATMPLDELRKRAF